MLEIQAGKRVRFQWVAMSLAVIAKTARNSQHNSQLSASETAITARYQPGTASPPGQAEAVSLPPEAVRI
jgi:hypothetical protein